MNIFSKKPNPKGNNWSNPSIIRRLNCFTRLFNKKLQSFHYFLFFFNLNSIWNEWILHDLVISSVLTIWVDPSKLLWSGFLIYLSLHLCVAEALRESKRDMAHATRGDFLFFFQNLGFSISINIDMPVLIWSCSGVLWFDEMNLLMIHTHVCLVNSCEME